MLRILLFFVIIFGIQEIFAQTPVELAGKAVDSYPGFIYTRSFNWDDPVSVAIDPNIYEEISLQADVYIVEHKTSEEWTLDPELNDARGFPQDHNFSGNLLTENFMELQDTETLSNISGARCGKGYDIVLDVDQDGQLSATDFIDGYSDEAAGLYLVNNMEESGPYDVDTLNFSESFWHTFRVYYPSNIAELEAQPLVVISHGWTHQYDWYDYIGEHLASYGYIVMSHRNEVGSGNAVATETASQTALENIDVFFDNEASMGDGILSGKVRHDQLVHTGHSTGGECVVRAYKRLYDGDYISNHITHEDIVLLNSLAPVAFLSPDETHPEGCNYHQFLCGADTDVSGAPLDNYQQALSIYERGYGNKQVTYIHGAGHSDLHGADDFPWAAGPDLIGKEATHTVVKPYFLALCELYTRNNLAVRDYFTRNRKEFRPSNIADSIKVSGEYRNAMSQGNFVIDDFQTQESLEFSSCGGIVLSDLFDRYEIIMKDHDGSFVWDDTQWSNGMCRSRYTDNPRCGALAWDGENRFMTYVIPDENQDWSLSEFLSFRACQITRHPFNTLEDLSFEVRLTDNSGTSSTISSGVYGPISRPYPKSNGGYLSLCLEEGTYSVVCGGSNWEEEMSFEIPGYIDGEAGTYELIIGSGDPCTEIEIFMYDTWGDGWDAGTLEIFNSEEESVAVGTLSDGTEPDPIGGWQNEFYTIQMRLSDFQTDNSGLNLNSIASLTFLFGENHGNESGAIGIDDIELSDQALTFDTIEEVVNLDPLSPEIYPNPMTDNTLLNLGAFEGEFSVRIYTAEGRVVRDYGPVSSSNLIISRGDLNAGLYLVQIQNGEGIHELKLIIE